MSPFRLAQLCAALALVLSGCQAPRVQHARKVVGRAKPPARPAAASAKAAVPAPVVAPASYAEPAGPIEEVPLPPVDEPELSLEALVAEVEARNPSLQAMIAAWQAAAQRYPQAVALDDPMFMAMIAPASLTDPGVQDSYMLQGSQRLPWFGKRAARGRAARAQANAAGNDLQDERVRLAEVVQVAFFDYYLAQRQQELNRLNLQVVREFREAAEAKYRTNQVTQQDLLQAEVELGELERRGIELDQANRVAVARINTLLLVDPFSPLPPPPRRLDPPTASIDVETLQQIALQRRPDLMALAARVSAEQAAIALARKEYYPDVEAIGRYDAFWERSEVRPDIGVNLNLPVYRRKLDAAVREALYRLNQRRAEYEQLAADVRYEVAVAYERLDESRRTVTLYAQRLLPAAEQNVAAARANYDVNRISFLELAVAERQLIELSEKSEDALATYHRRRAALQRSLGGAIPEISGPPPQPPSR